MSHSKSILLKNIQALENQFSWLERSYLICQYIPSGGKYSPEEMDALETLCSRSARSIDYLIRKVFRSIDDVEFENQGTLIDVVNNAEKRGLIESTDKLREIKELWNDIVHEYVLEEAKSLFADVIKATRSVLEIMQNTITYCSKYRQ
ncbi:MULTISPECIES: hypothetical protein [Methylomonas]|uniref:DUF86 domain-containing protein n=2 Tax=Methylomonas TaxID=416 RepID=A0A140E5L8_9GAMM|nr:MULTISPECIES: hypothetical protein [Methylomonas]AMK78692.1 hypothetical protein JT25_019730 [Methylomonas denitrificans]OAI03688.1 hypothetical protein A1342_00985 [Methylomonas methanica]TCV83556.1 hypothetical protein EDE11_109113 [Methylomonas methanica]